MKKMPDNQITFYQSLDGSVNIEVLFAEENIWLTQKKIAELFATTPQNITQHLANIYLEREVDKQSTCKDFLQVQTEGKREVKRNTTMYSLEAIIAVGYRINSERGTQFRQWATGILKNYIHKGYALDVNRMKYGSRFTAIDYSPQAFESKEFFATVQNKLHFAITGKTAAEIITNRVSSKKEKLGLTSWRRSPQGKIMPSDTVIAKNYLDKKELEHLNRIGNIYLDYAEMQAARGRAMTMQDWIEKLNAFLKFSEYEILTNAGKISHEVAEALALKEYEKFRKIQDKNYVSDFDAFVNKTAKFVSQGKKKKR